MSNRKHLPITRQVPRTASMLPDAHTEELKQKHMLGDRIFPVIYSWYPDMCGKITGKLLQMDNSELLHLLQHHEALKAKAEEAVALLKAHRAKETPSDSGGAKKEA